MQKPPCPKCNAEFVERLPFTSPSEPVEWLACLRCGQIWSEPKQPSPTKAGN
jgi:hypothetical protein